MERQLVLMDDTEGTESDWRLDERTRQLGREGVAAARTALRVSSSGRVSPQHEPTCGPRQEDL